MHEIHAPAFPGAAGARRWAPVQGDVLAPPDAHAELQPSSRYSRRTRLRLTTQPSRRSSTQMRRCPNRGRAWANSRIRSRSADWSRARLRRYQAARLNWASRQARAPVRVLLLPRVERGLADPQLPAHVADRGAALGLAQRVGDLLLGEFRALHRSRPFVWWTVEAASVR